MIEIKELTKVYKDSAAVDHINLKIKEGELFAFLGPNGAGKTTLILMLSTLLKPTSGTAAIEGHDIHKKPDLIKRDIGILFQDTSLDDRLTGRENLEIQTVLYDVPKDKRTEKIVEMLDFVGLNDWADVPVQRYSGGMRRRLEIARSLIHSPKVLLLDEPTLGLDPKAREAVWQHIKRLEDMTIIITTNYIEEAEMLADRIVIMDSGRIAALGSPEELKSSLKMDLGQIIARSPEKLKPVLEDLPYVDIVRVEGRKILFTIKEGMRQALLNNLASHDLESIEVRRPTLNDVFLKHVGRSIQVSMEKPKNRRRLGKKRRGR